MLSVVWPYVAMFIAGAACGVLVALLALVAILGSNQEPQEMVSND
jgi:hypothetical protein